MRYALDAHWLEVGARQDVRDLRQAGYSTLGVDSYTTHRIASVRTSGGDWEPQYGVGGALKIGKSFGIRSDWEAWDTAESPDAWSARVYFRFGAR